MKHRICYRLIALILATFVAIYPVYAEGVSNVPQPVIAISNGKISLDLKGIDIVEALKILSTRGNLNMVIGGNIQGRVTLFLKDVDIQDALEIMLISSGLAYDKKGDILYVMTQRDYEQVYGENFGGKKEVLMSSVQYAKASDIAKSLEQAKTRMGKLIVDDVSNTIIVMDSAASIVQIEAIIKKLDQPIMTRVINLKYAKSADIKNKIAEMLTKGVGFVQVDERTNKIAVFDIPSKIGEIEKVILAFDEKPKQVLIEAKIVQVTLDDRFKLGVDWETLFRSFRKDFQLAGSFALASQGAVSPGVEAVVGTFGQTDYAMLIQALKTVGDTNLLSSPRITALNNQEAKILVGSSVPYATNTVVTPGGGAATTTATTLSFLDIGVKLFVTPTISEDGFVSMKIKPEVSSEGTTPYTYGDPATTVPVVQTTQAETSVSVKDGNTIIIAGLIKDERIDSSNKVPIAGDVPLFGHLFKKTDKHVVKQELVIFITPHIISGADEVLEVPSSPPLGENRFTSSERTAFERRKPQPLDPSYFRRERRSKPSSNTSSMARISKPSSAQEYYYAVKDQILNHLEFKTQRVPKGSIKISFRLNAKGQLISGPQVQNSTNAVLDSAILEAVKRAAPFSEFPIEITNPEKEFTVDFVIE